MFKRNPGRFRYEIHLLKPSEPTRDELGGIKPVSYEPLMTAWAMCEQRNQSRQQVVGDYVTVATRYFVVRDLAGTPGEGIDANWRIRMNGRVYIINDVLLIDESAPHFIQITATAISTGGGVNGL